MASIRASRAAEQPWMSPMAMVRGIWASPQPVDQGFSRQMAKFRAAAYDTQAR